MEGEGKPLLSNRRSTLEPDEWSNTSKGMSHSLNVVAVRQNNYQRVCVTRGEIM